MLDTGLIAAQIAFILLLYLFVWRIVRSSSKSIDPIRSEPTRGSSPPIVAPVAAQARPPVAAAPPPAEPAPADVPAAAVPAAAAATEMPAVVRIPPPGQEQAPPAEPSEAAPAPPADEIPDRHPLLDDPMPPPEGESALDHAPVWEPEAGHDRTPEDDRAEAPHDGGVANDEPTTDDGAPPEGPEPSEDEELPPALAGEGVEAREEAEDAAAAAAAAASLDEAGARRGRTDGGGVINLDNLAPRLVVEESPAAQVGTEMDLSGGLTIGRSGSSDFTVDDPFVSHMHARVLRRGAYYFVEDLGSTNGTFLNDQEVERDARLKVRDTLRIGQTVLRYEE
jgi:hypothetical protein